MQRQLGKTLSILAVGLAGLLSLVLGLGPTPVAAAPSTYLNFQARLLTSTGAVVADGDYNVEFKIYDSLSSGGSSQGSCSLDSSTDDCWWIETRTGGNKVRVVNGYMSVKLGNVTAFGSNIPWNQELWLTMNIGGTGSPSYDGEMSPRIQLTALPYAFRAEKLAKTSGSNTGTLAFNTVGNNPVIVLPDESGTVCTTGSICSGYQAAGSYFLQGGNSFTGTATLGTNDNFGLNLEVNNVTVASFTNTGAALFKNQADSATAFQIQNAAGTVNLFTADTLNTQISMVRSIFSGNILPVSAPTSQSTSLVLATADSHASDDYGRHNAIAIAPDGLPVVSYTDTTNTDLRVLKCGNSSCSSGNTSVLADGASGYGEYTDIVISPDGLPVISQKTPSGSNLRVTKCTNPSCSTNTSNDVETSNNVGNYSSIAIGTDGLPIIAHKDETDTNPRVLKCGNATCTSGNTATAIDVSGDNIGDDIKIAIAPDGLPVLAYQDVTNTNLRVTKCGNASCSSGNTTTAIDVSGDNVGDAIDLAIGADGLPLVAYHDTTNTDVRVLKCGNAACSSGNTITSIDTAGTTGQDISMAIGKDGYPVIAYRDGSNSALRATKCGNLACSTGNVSTTLEDTANAVGEMTSIAIGIDGLPVIMHYDSTNDDLRVARCGNTACSGTGTTLSSGIQIGSTDTPFQNAYVQNIQTTGAFNPFTLSTNGVERLSIDGSGNTTFKNTDSTTAFQVQRANGGGTLFTIDTSTVSGSRNGIITVGTSDTTGTLFVVDTKTDAGDPTGVNGAMYYNSNSNKLRCFENSAWADCIAAGVSTTLQQAYTNSTGGTTPEIKLDSTRGAVDIQDADSTISGNLLNVRASNGAGLGSILLGVGNTGATVFQNSVNSSTAFQVQNATGVRLFNINTLTSGLNLTFNPSMEQNTDGWVLRSVAGSPTIKVSDTFANFGSRSLEIVTSTGNGNGAEYRFPFAPSTQYSLSLYARRSTSSAASFNIGRADNGTDTDCLTNQTIDTNWTQFSCTFTTGATIGNASNFYIKQTDTTTDTIYIDGVTLVAGATALAFTSPAQNIQVDANYSNLTFNNTNTGEIQPWQLNAVELPAGLKQGGVVSANGYIYYIGGRTTSGGLQEEVYYAKLNADGTIGSWTTNAINLPLAMYTFGTAAYNGYLYAIGGWDGTASRTSVYYAKLNADGSTGAWQTGANSLPAGRSDTDAMIANGFVYMIGGDNGGSQNTVYYAKLNADGSTGAWQTNANNICSAQARIKPVVANGYVYVIGGSGATTVCYAKLNADGTTGTFTTTTALPAARGYHGVVVSNGYVYVYGGQAASGSAETTVYYAKLNSDGTVGSWSTSSNPIPALRSQFGSLAINGYIYTVGGTTTNAGSGIATIYYTSTSRMLVGGSLDLVGLSGQVLGDVGATGGSLTAGNTSIIGSLDVRERANFTNGVGIGGALNVGGTVNFQNSSGFSVLSTNSSGISISVFSGNLSNSSAATLQSTSTVNTTVDSTGTVGSATSIAIGTDGLPIVSYFDTTNQDLKVMKCGNSACTSGNTISTVDSSLTNVGDGTAIGIGGDGLPIIAYYTTTGGNLRVSKCANIACTALTATTDVDTTNNVGRQPDLAIGTDGFAVISHWDSTNNNIRVTKCNNANCSSVTNTDVDGGSSIIAGTTTSVAVGHDGNPIISYYETATTSCDDSPTTECSLHVAKYVGSGGTGCTSSAWTCTIVENPTSTGNVGDYSDIAIGRDGIPVVAFYDTGNTDPKLLRCGNTHCTTVASSTVVDTGTATIGQEMTVTIGKDGLPILAYKDSTNTDLRVTKCGNLACSSGNTNTTVDATANTIAEWTDIAVLPDGLPVISHYDNTADDLKISRCGSVTCAASGSTYTGGIDLGSDATPFQNGYMHNLNIQDVSGFQLLNTDAANKKITVKADIIAGNSATTTTGTTEATPRTNVTTVTLIAAGSFVNNDVILLDNAGQDYYTRIVSGGGTTTLTVSPAVSYDASAPVIKYNVQNIGATVTDYTTQSDRFFQGYFLGGVVTGAGSTTLSDGMLTSTNELRIVAPNINLQRSSDSSSAFQVQNANGLQIFNIDSNSDASNLVTNPSLETNTTGWATHNSSVIARTTSHQYIGSASLQVDANATNEGAKYSLTLTNSQVYSLSLYAKLDSGTFAAFQIGHSNDNSTDSSCLTAQTVLTGGWTRFSCSFTYTGTTGTSYFYAKQTNSTTRTFYLDAVKLETGSIATAYREAGLLLNGVVTSQLIHRITNDSTAAFQVQTSTGTPLITADTLNSKVTIGTFVSDVANGQVGVGTNVAFTSTFNVEGTTKLSYNGSSAALNINRSSGSGNQILIQDNGTDIFSMGDSGNTLFKNSANSTTAFQVQQAGAGSTLFTIDTQNTKVIVNNSHIAITQTTAPTIGTPTNCGTSPTAAVTTGSADTAGSFRITAGTGSPTTCDTIITFNITYGSAPKAIILTPTTAIASATGFKGAQVSAVNTTTFTVKLTTNPAASEVNSFYYWVVE